MTVGLVEQVGTAPAGRDELQGCSWEQEELTIAGANNSKSSVQASSDG